MICWFKTLDIHTKDYVILLNLNLIENKPESLVMDAGDPHN